MSYNESDGRHIAPQQLHAGYPSRQGGTTTSTHRRRCINPALLPPGAFHQLPGFPTQLRGQTHHYTPQTVLESTVPTYALSGAPIVRWVEYLPRQPKHLGRSFNEPPCTFTVGGIPGPYLSQLATGKVVLDNPHEPVFTDTTWSGRTQIVFDFPGLRTRPIWRMNIIIGPDKHPITRQEFAMEVTSRIMLALVEGKAELQSQAGGKYAQDLSPGEEKWRFDRVKYRQLRLISMNHYGTTWVPVLAIDVENRH